MRYAQKTLHEYRITLAHLYGPETLGHTDPARRQGHYIQATDPWRAIRTFVEGRCGHKASDRFDVEYWRPVCNGHNRPIPLRRGLIGRFYVEFCSECKALIRVAKEDV